MEAERVIAESLPEGRDPGTLVHKPYVQLDSYTADGVFVRHIYVAEAHVCIPQHSHCHEHLTMVAWGSVDVWVKGEHRGRISAPGGIVIPAGINHLFETLEPATTLYCIHNVTRTGRPEVEDE